ncbi:hypothetical protein [Segetibacter koreensis]|uniref:hypothetical protein n=1 Tax=Segetibacter koreensis TaxID=398037 RepID=UPI00036545EC|nr:hypothetical protein [Segetibacter koreensis]
MQRNDTGPISISRDPFNKIRRNLIWKNLNIRFWLFSILILAVIFLIESSTIDVMPSLQKDEIQITDYGRLTLNPLSDWSVNWLVPEGKPILLWSYLGPLLSELSYQIFGNSGLGPRIAALLGGLVAAIMSLKWLSARQVPLYAACCLSLAFLLDPLFVLSQRMARVDSWVIAICLAACWLLRASDLKRDKFLWIRIVCAGGLSAVAALVWPSSIFLYPLIMLEFAHLVKFKISDTGSWKYAAINVCYFIAGWVFFLTILLVPIWHNLSIIFNDMSSVVSKNVDTSRSFSTRIYAIFNQHLWMKLIKAFVKTLSLFLPLLAIFGAIYRREKGLILVTVFVVALIFATLIYELRVLYLLPYLLPLSGGIFQRLADTPAKLLLRRISVYALVGVVLWAVVTSLFVRSVLGYQDKMERSRGKILHAAKASIGRGDYRVFLAFNYELYYAGRSLGWKLYTPYGQQDYDSEGNWIDKGYNPYNKFIELFSEMDYAIFSDGNITKELSNELDASGLRYYSKMLLNNEEGSLNESRTGGRMRDLILFYLQGTKNYGPYLIYKRTKNPIVEASLR